MFDRFPNQSPQWLQLRGYDRVKTSYHNPNMRNAFWENTF